MAMTRRAKWTIGMLLAGGVAGALGFAAFVVWLHWLNAVISLP